MLELRMLRVDIKEELQDVQKWVDSAEHKSPYLEGVQMGLNLALQNIEIALVNSKRSDLVNEMLEE